ELLSRLVDQSLVQVERDAQELRYRLLATVRQYALARLEEQPDETLEVRARHAAFFAELVARGQQAAAGADRSRWLLTLESDRDNLSQALGWQLEHAPAQAASMASALWPFWYQRGHYREARGWFEQIIAAAPEMPPRERAQLLVGLGEVAFL